MSLLLIFLILISFYTLWPDLCSKAQVCSCLCYKITIGSFPNLSTAWKYKSRILPSAILFQITFPEVFLTIFHRSYISSKLNNCFLLVTSCMLMYSYVSTRFLQSTFILCFSILLMICINNDITFWISSTERSPFKPERNHANVIQPQVGTWVRQVWFWSEVQLWIGCVFKVWYFDQLVSRLVFIF
jgi:hypothetical protein